jgi:hypothetical protein
MQDPGLVKLYYDLGVDALHSSSAELQAFNDNEVAKYAKIIKEKNIHVD